MEQTIHIKDVGPISSLDIPMPQAGGVVVLRGRNGSGKTSAIDSINCMLSKNGRSPGPRDGVKRGSVEGLGLKMSVGRKNVSTGTLLVETLEGKLDVSDLVDPGIINAESADAKRIKALLSLADVTPSIDIFAELIPIDRLKELVPPEVHAKDDVLQLAGRVKRAFEKEALKAEGEAVRAFTECQGFQAAIKDVDFNQESDSSALQAQLEKAIRYESELKERHRSAMNGQLAASDARRQLEAAKAVKSLSPEEAEIEYERASDGVGHANGEVLRLREELAAAQAALNSGINALTLARNLFQQADAARTQAKSRAAAIAGWEQAVSQSETLGTVKPEELHLAASNVTAARQAVELGAIVRQAVSTREKAEAAELQAAQARTFAEQWRQAAAGVEEVLGDLVGKLGVPLRVRVADGQVRLVTQHARGEIPFSDLSHGERWRMALDLAIEAVGSGGVLTIRQEAWEALDPQNRDAIRQHVEGRGVVVLTAEAAEGELQAVQVQPLTAGVQF